MKRPIPTDYVARTIRAANRRGIDLTPALQQAGLGEVLADPGAVVTPEQATAFTQAVWDITGDELGGLGAAPVPRGTFRLVTLALIHSPDLEHALRRMMSSLPALPAMTPISFRYSTNADAGTGTLELGLRNRSPDLVTQLLIELSFLLIHRFYSWLIGRAITPVTVTLPHSAPDDYEPQFYRSLYGVAPHFGASTASLVFDRATLHAPVVQNEGTLREFLRNSPAVLFSEPSGKTPLTTKVRRMIERGVAGGVPDAATIAERLSMSESHLRRLLRAEGTSVNQLRQEVLCDAALVRLRRGEAIDQISGALGFSEPSAFRRAFKRWTGTSPGAFRTGVAGSSAPR